MDNSKSLIQISNLEVVRSDKKILTDFTLTIIKGSPFAIVGESGSGKTTLLYSILGLIPPRDVHGSILIEGKDPAQLSARERAKLVGLVFQDYALFPHFTVLENVVFASSRGGRSNFRETGLELLRQLGIEDLKYRYPHEISGGQKQRVAIARSLALQPIALFFDEPSAALDTKTTEELARLLLEINSKTQIIVVSHDLPFIKRFCNRGCLIQDGRLKKNGTIDEIIQRDT